MKLLPQTKYCKICVATLLTGIITHVWVGFWV